MSSRAIALLVLADDRTGALETAGLCADAGMRTVVTPRTFAGDLPEHECRVVDLGSRRVAAAEAARRVTSVDVPARRVAHKIDSTLQGNWAAELAAHTAPVMLVPAFPAAGRTCVGGVVHVHGEPIGRPADRLPPEITVHDAATDADLERLGATWRDDPTVVLAGTAGAIGAAVGATTRRPPPRVRGRVLVVCGSRQPIAREQAARVPADVDVVYRASDAIGRAAAVLVIVGGDTAATVLGDRALIVGGTIETGVAWSRYVDGTGPLVVTKPGGFGDELTLARVIEAILEP